MSPGSRFGRRPPELAVAPLPIAKMLDCCETGSIAVTSGGTISSPIRQPQHGATLHLDQEQQDVLRGDLGRQRPMHAQYDFAMAAAHVQVACQIVNLVGRMP